MEWTKWRWSFKCHFIFTNSGKLVTVDALDVIQLSEAVSGWKPGFFVICPIFADDSDLPDYVGITDKSYDEHEIKDRVNFIGITYPRNLTEDSATTIAVCPGPIQGKYENALRIAEYVEMNSILGASKFYFYNMSMSREVEHLAKFYESQGLVEIVSWNIDDVLEMSESVIHYYGIMATLNDCFYRATAIDNFKYVILTDFDEIIFPYATETLKEFLENFDSPAYHSLRFSNYFVFGEYPKDFSNVPENAVNKFLYTQAHMTRMRDVTGDYFWWHVRTKTIAKRDYVTEAGNHYTWNSIGATKELFVPHRDAMMYHYREDCLKGHCDQARVNDTFARKFGNELWERVDGVCGKVFEDGKCPIGKINVRVQS